MAGGAVDIPVPKGAVAVAHLHTPDSEENAYKQENDKANERFSGHDKGLLDTARKGSENPDIVLAIATPSGAVKVTDGKKTETIAPKGTVKYEDKESKNKPKK